MTPLLTPESAIAIVSALFEHLYDEPITSVDRQKQQLSLIAHIVVDATYGCITNQPLHEAYRACKQIRGIA